MEDIKFRAYLEENGWDTTQRGSKAYQMKVAEEMDRRAVESDEKL